MRISFIPYIGVKRDNVLNNEYRHIYCLSTPNKIVKDNEAVVPA